MKQLVKSRILQFITLAAISVSTLSACGEKSVENLEATCERLRSNMKPFESIELLSRKLYYDGDSVAMLLGGETREDNKRFIHEKFPFMRSYTISGIRDGDYEKGVNDYRIQTALHVFSSTPNPIFLSDEDLTAIEASADPYSEIVEPKVLRIIGESYSDKGCVGLDSRNNVDYSLRVEELYSDTLEAAEDSLNHLLGILLCDRDGKIDDVKCDSVDFDSSVYGTSSSTELTEEERAILAEREADAEKESQNQSSTTEFANVSPGQICSNLGQIVETEDYGSLMCKLVTINRIRGLFWMRA